MNPDSKDIRPLRIKSFLDLAIARSASDLHLVVGRPPILRIQGSLKPLELPVLEADYLKDVIYEILTDRQKAQLRETRELDFSYHYLNEYFFRINVHVEKGYVGSTIRIMPGITKSLEALGLPAVVADLSMRRSGLVLIVGRAGMGKTTTMIHMVDHINQNRYAKIVTVEDPIEFVHQSKKSLIIQREVGTDTVSFDSGLRHALRQDPDVIVIGETRDLDSISMALTAAETGHLVLATLHSPDAIEAINRIIDVYPGDKQNQIRVQLAETLLGVISQQLLPMKNSTERVLAAEVLVANMAIRNLIRRNVLPEIRGQMETGREGMNTTEQSLSALLKRGAIDLDVARAHAKYPDYIKT
ncbi:MAG: PilT/PilU family type 4a pilus ATPase [Candidatus Omnitrophica bacterium]|nr:PilT/PilU family type 4a pilus ATPase [Candidatus Omnitrophota bacterium]